MVHLWVEQSFEFFTSATSAYLLMTVGLVSRKLAERAVYLELILIFLGGVIGTGHHIYWVGGPGMWVPMGSMFSFIEVLPLVLLIRFLEASFWWMHAMVLVWLLFTVMLFVLEPAFVHRWVSVRANAAPESTFALIEWLHRTLLALSIVTVFVAGSHGLLLKPRSGYPTHGFIDLPAVDRNGE